MGNLCDKHYLIAEEASEDGTVDNCIVCNLEEQHKADKALLRVYYPLSAITIKAEQFLDKVSKEGTDCQPEQTINIGGKDIPIKVVHERDLPPNTDGLIIGTSKPKKTYYCYEINGKLEWFSNKLAWSGKRIPSLDKIVEEGL